MGCRNLSHKQQCVKRIQSRVSLVTHHNASVFALRLVLLLYLSISSSFKSAFYIMSNGVKYGLHYKEEQSLE